MAKRRYRERKCKCCHRRFLPQPHNAYHQKFCVETACQAASRRESQRKYNRKHPDRYKGKAEVIRVRIWREEHPHYWRRKRRRILLRIELFWDESGLGRRLRVLRERWLSGALRDLYRVQLALPRQLTTCLDRAIHNLLSLLPAVC